MRRLALLGIAAVACGSEAPPPPNLLLIVADTLRADHLGCYGGPRDLGREICRLGEQGTRFVWAFATAPYTAPSMASILTSQYAGEHRLSQFDAEPLAEDRVTVAEMLAAAGYATACFVSNPVLRRARNLVQGFEVYDDHMDRAEINRPGYGERVAAHTTDAALAWARGAPEPWFLCVHYQDPHGPYAAPGAAAAADPPGAAKLPVLPDHSGFEGIPQYQALKGVFAAESYRERYEDEIRYLDRHVGRLIDGLDTLGRRPQVVFTADHGEALGEDGFYFAHGHSLGIDQIRVPLLVRPAKPRAARVVVEPVSGVDIAPTLLRAAGLAPPASFRGRALPVAADEAPGARGSGRTLLAEHPVRAAVVRDGLYYARDTVSLEAPVVDPNTDGRLRPLPARTAVLGADGHFGGYAEPGESARGHEAAVRARLSAGAGAAAPAPRDAETEAMLRSLGYIDRPREPRDATSDGETD